ncbi:MAG: hypothetical protein COB35_05095 [Gammaproteobacteria bacterium]|nr:MAG: hypothetical protein COB35_05095 [Gammaproteobacteria bacterium]
MPKPTKISNNIKLQSPLLSSSTAFLSPPINLVNRAVLIALALSPFSVSFAVNAADQSKNNEQALADIEVLLSDVDKFIPAPTKKREDHPEMPPQNYLDGKNRLAAAKFMLSVTK